MQGRYTFYKTLIVTFTIAGLVLLWYLAEVIGILFGAIIFASAIRPLVNRLTNWGLNRGLSILLIYLLVFGTLVGLLTYSIPPLFNAFSTLLSDEGFVYNAAGRVYSWFRSIGYHEIGVNVATRIGDEWQQLQGRINNVSTDESVSLLRNLVEGVGQFFLGLAMAFYWLTARDQIQGLMLAITPMRYRARTEEIFNEVELTLGGYVRGTVLLMLSIFTMALVGLLLLGVPFALPLALIAGLMEALPLVGATLGAIPAVLVALTVSPITALLTILLFVLIQAFENYVLVPRVHQHSLGLNPLTVIVAVVAGGLLNGVVGAVLAVPIVGAFQVILQELVLEPMKEEAREAHDEHGVPVFEVEPAGAPNEKGSEGIIIARS